MAKPVGRDPCLDTLLLLDGEVFVIDERGGHWVKFDVKRVEESPSKPHGLDYSLTLHAADGTRLVGFDNAHRVASGESSGRARLPAYDHRHRLAGSGRTIIGAPQTCWRIFGKRSRMSLGNEE